MTPSRWRRALSVAGNSVLWVTAVLGAVSIVLAVATVVAGVQPLIFRSSSMEPAISAGALGLARTVDATEVEVGDVISVEGVNGVRVTHRVVEVDPTGAETSFVLKGDANRQPDANSYVATEVDRVFFDVPYLGYVANAMASPWALFGAGIAVTLAAVVLWRRGDGARRPGVGAGVAAVAAIGLAAGAVNPVPTTEAWFADPARFEAGTIQAHQVRIFDWGSPVCTDNAGGTVTLRSLVASPRYRQAWYVAPVGSSAPANPFHRASPTGAIDSVVETTITRAMLGSPPVGTYQITAKSELKGAATTPWLSNATRNVQVTVVDANTVRCGSVNLPPTIDFTAPRDGVTYLSTEHAQTESSLLCARRTPCGTATDSNGIHSVEYRLQRSTWLSTRCWNPELSSFTLSGCGTWRGADTTPSTPTSAGTVVWRVPEGIVNGTTFLQSGEFTLYMRVTDNSPQRSVSERTIRFTVR